MHKLLAGVAAGLLFAGFAVAAPAHADSDGPRFSDVSIPGYASTSLPMSFSVTDTHATVSSVTVAVNGTTVETLRPTDMRPRADGSGYDASTSIPTTTYADGQTLTVTLTASDDNGNPSGLAGENVIVDHTKPVVGFTGNLAYQANPTATVAFSATDAHLLSVSCRLDQFAAAPCSGSVTYTGITPGLHAVRVTAVDLAGNTTVGQFQITDSAPRITAIAGSFTTTLLRNSAGQLVATVAGDAVPAVVPTGTLTVMAGSRLLGVAPLVASATPDVATATLPVTTLGPARTAMTMSYSGDSLYPAATGLDSYVVRGYGTMALIGAVRHDRKVTVGISCPKSAAACKGSVVLGGKTLRLTPAPGRFTRLTFSLPGSAITALDLRGSAVVRLDLSSGPKQVRHLTITLHAPKAQRKVT